jgi:hypothetical protein
MNGSQGSVVDLANRMKKSIECLSAEQKAEARKNLFQSHGSPSIASLHPRVRIMMCAEIGGRSVQHGNLLVARLKITTYNQHRSAPFFRASVVYCNQVYSELGADAFI